MEIHVAGSAANAMGLDVILAISQDLIMKNFKTPLLICFFFFGVNTALAQTVPIPTLKPTTTATSKDKVEPEIPSGDQKEKRIYQSACPAVLNGKVIARPLPPIEDNQCGERSPLEVSHIAGVKLTGKAIMNCRMAITLASWVQDAHRTAEEVMKTGIKSIISSTSYQCRRRNNAADGKISEHGFANAFDIIGFNLEDGSKITLADDWPLIVNVDEKSSGTRQDAEISKPTLELTFLKALRDQACEHFTTVLGPESNPLHADHFHFDLGCHGRNCTYKICE